MAKNEKKVQDVVLGDLRSLGKYCEVFKIMKASDAGEPDIFFTTCLTGAIFIETKRLTGAVRKLQKAKIEKLNRCGSRTFVCHSIKEWVDIKRQLSLSLENVKSAHNRGPCYSY